MQRHSAYPGRGAGGGDAEKEEEEEEEEEEEGIEPQDALLLLDMTLRRARCRIVGLRAYFSPARFFSPARTFFARAHIFRSSRSWNAEMARRAAGAGGRVLSRFIRRPRGDKRPDGLRAAPARRLAHVCARRGGAGRERSLPALAAGSPASGQCRATGFDVEHFSCARDVHGSTGKCAGTCGRSHPRRFYAYA